MRTKKTNWFAFSASILLPFLSFLATFLTCKTSPNPLFLERLSNLSMGPKLSFLAPFSTLILSPFLTFWGIFLTCKTSPFSLFRGGFISLKSPPKPHFWRTFSAWFLLPFLSFWATFYISKTCAFSSVWHRFYISKKSTEMPFPPQGNVINCHTVSVCACPIHTI